MTHEIAQAGGVTKPPTWQVPGAASSGVHRVVTVCDQHQAVMGLVPGGSNLAYLNRSVNKRTQGIPKKMEKDGQVTSKKMVKCNKNTVRFYLLLFLYQIAKQAVGV